jgi:cytochrome c oxidase assembly factor CtaG
VLGRPLAVWAWALTPPWRRRLGAVFRHAAWRVPWRLFTAPLAAWSVHATALWLWHMPVLFDAALHDDTVHAWQHASFLSTALLFWWSVLGPRERRRVGVAIASLFTTMLHTGALGALLTLSPRMCTRRTPARRRPSASMHSKTSRSAGC